MALDDDIRILSTVGLFESFTAEQLRLLAFGAERLVLRAGRELFREGQSADCAYVVVSGNISLFRDGEGGRVTIRSVGPGAILGEIALIAQTTRLTGAFAEVETEVIRLSRAIFHRILEEYPEVAVALHTHVSRNLTDLIRQIEKLSPLFKD
ncbi:cyclic nucleotide-binding domain-containing protein [Phyllobacterium salinisoli]|uniref:Cyclic nucleotide-binding domain-containing protein n=1 Tax=Phyllobacterium salinisoli TaxID=1899321 RepID=A0A368JZS3_9HYPH|nr:cyclic nucleotide-binding domain-containing protein [Phyllobacterium salinisoli]RCS22414.1 cyclic nucleotide-binding domain-containing protein [Phyllobacterium salinisoli]